MAKQGVESLQALALLAIKPDDFVGVCIAAAESSRACSPSNAKRQCVEDGGHTDEPRGRSTSRLERVLDLVKRLRQNPYERDGEDREHESDADNEDKGGNTLFICDICFEEVGDVSSMMSGCFCGRKIFCENCTLDESYECTVCDRVAKTTGGDEDAFKALREYTWESSDRHSEDSSFSENVLLFFGKAFTSSIRDIIDNMQSIESRIELDEFLIHIESEIYNKNPRLRRGKSVCDECPFMFPSKIEDLTEREKQDRLIRYYNEERCISFKTDWCLCGQKKLCATVCETQRCICGEKTLCATACLESSQCQYCEGFLCDSCEFETPERGGCVCWDCIRCEAYDESIAAEVYGYDCDEFDYI